MPSANASDTSVTGALPQVPAGYYFLTVVTNAIPGGRVVRVQGTPFLPPTVVTPAPDAMVNTLLTSGTAEVGSTVTLLVDGREAGTTRTDAHGGWTLTPGIALGQGRHTLTAQATDPAGNRSVASPLRAFSVDSVAPGAPVVVTPAPGAVVNTSAPVVSGTAEPGSTVTLFLDGRVVATVVASATGSWSSTLYVVLLTGSYSLTALATDAVGNTSQQSPSNRTSHEHLRAEECAKLSQAI
ncbi:Ig-like domain-containing protein [Archangium violaceum]|uniref:Ig-like domain-containing protein n=1 Tax=Archangium violaceum TaxID=83451 RepID=UPI002B31B0D4|nr:Ig-like domain-containing protein [Archangium gephyra]